MNRFLSPFLLILGLLFFHACKPDGASHPVFLKTADVNAKVAHDWFDLEFKLIQETPGFTGPVAARALAYTSLALYESVVGGMEEYKTLQGELTNFLPGSVPEPALGLEYHWGVCANRAMALMLTNLFKTASEQNKKLISDLEDNYEATFKKSISDDVFNRSKELGDHAGSGVYKYAKSDNQDEAYSKNYPATFNVQNFNGAWKPTPPNYQSIPLQPYWGGVRAFNSANSNLLVDPHPTYSVSPISVFYAQALDVYTLKTSITQEQKNIIDFWFDEPGITATSAGHAMNILKQVLKETDATLALSAEAYSKMGLSLHDAYVSCWKTKFQYDLMRPITFIRAQIDPSFSTYLSTPAFPEYTSSNAVLYFTMAQILTDLFGANYPFTDKTNLNRIDMYGAERSYSTFMDAANEAANSSLYAGHQFRTSVESGKKQGLLIGKNASSLPYRK
ncbi:MAG: vanadium-dependent haloperoxidase [Bacteroidetes bacterium]|nr:vanadium-dependent haloperoxidase [Bacteroidota bacterium]